MEHAINNIYKLTSNIDLQLFHFTNFGKNIPKMLKLSPDAFFQVCLQLAHWRYVINRVDFILLHFVFAFF